MLGWVMRRAGGGAPNDFDDTIGDTTQLDPASNTPAPIFAARAFKSAIFGSPTPTPREETMTTMDLTQRTPTKQPTSILMTPGTAASKRKKVSFNHDVMEKNASSVNLQKKKEPLVINKSGRTPLFETLEKASTKRSPAGKAPSSKKKTLTKKPADIVKPSYAAPGSGDEWEDDDDTTNNLNNFNGGCNHDVTVDIADPKSESGSYWKKMHEEYRKDAQHEMVKCLKKCKSLNEFAQAQTQKAIAAEANLEAEKKRNKELEKMMADLKAQVTTSRWQSFKTPANVQPARDDKVDILRNLAEQTTKAAEYKKQVAELEDLLKDRSMRMSLTGRSPSAALDAQRELRRAKSQLREVNELKRDLDRTKSELAATERKMGRLEDENKRLQARADDDSRLEELKRQLRESREQTRRAEEDLRVAKAEFQEFRDNTFDKQSETTKVLERSMDKIAELKAEIRVLKRRSDAAAATKTLEKEKEREQQEKEKERPKSMHDLGSTTPPLEDDTGVLRGHLRSFSQPMKSVPSKPTATSSKALVDQLSAKLPGAPVSKPVSSMFDATDLSLDFHPDLSATDTSSPYRKQPSAYSQPQPQPQPRPPKTLATRLPARDDKVRLDPPAALSPWKSNIDDITFDLLETPRPAKVEKKETAQNRNLGREQVRDKENERPPREPPTPGNASILTLGNTGKSALPLDRRAAAVARIEKRRAEKMRAMGKENLRA